MAIKKQEEGKVTKVEDLHQNIIEDLFKSERNFHDQIIKGISEIRKDIQYSVKPEFLDLSIGVKDLIELAIEIWRMEQKLNKIVPTLPEGQREGINNSIQKLKRYLYKTDIEVLDNTNQKYNEGRNLDILAVEKDANIKESVIKETKEPTIIYKGKVVRKGKVIVLINETQSSPEIKK